MKKQILKLKFGCRNSVIEQAAYDVLNENDKYYLVRSKGGDFLIRKDSVLGLETKVKPDREIVYLLRESKDEDEIERLESLLADSFKIKYSLEETMKLLTERHSYVVSLIQEIKEKLRGG